MTMRGTSGFKYNSGAVTYPMEWTLQNPRPGVSRTRFASWSLDKTNLEVLYIGTGAAEIEFDIRFENSPEDLLAMLEWGANGGELTFYPTLAGGTSYPCFLLAPSGDEISLVRDRILGIRKRYEVRIKLRRTDGGNFDALL